MSSDVSNFEPSGGSCLNCGGHVTEQYRRVFGDNDDQVHACPNCEEKMFGDERLTAGLDQLPTVGGGGR